MQILENSETPSCKLLHQEAGQLGSAALQYFCIRAVDRESPLVD